jgi:murein DD-endopeptidase MepM/ murein hydrolase activator NlpD
MLSNENEPDPLLTPNNKDRYISITAWIIATGLIFLTLYIGWKSFYTPQELVKAVPITSNTKQQITPIETNQDDVASKSENKAQVTDLPDSNKLDMLGTSAIARVSNLHTDIPNRPHMDFQIYTVQPGDSVFEIAAKFNISPESVLWANYEKLNDNPHAIAAGMELYIPPVNGVLYKWQDGDTIQSVAIRFKTDPEKILGWPANNIDLVSKQIEPGTLVMIPDGQREFKQWLIPTIPRGRSGVSRAVYGSGACEGGYEGAYGDGAFIWPADNHTLSGNDYWSGHLAIDIAAGEGARIYAADSGVVVFAGWTNAGYGNTIMIDHGNGYQTLYGHLSSIKVHCGQSVYKGNVIGYSGSTGNSTGPHLHFEVRYQGGFVNPWYVLPAP